MRLVRNCALLCTCLTVLAPPARAWHPYGYRSGYASAVGASQAISPLGVSPFGVNTFGVSPLGLTTFGVSPLAVSSFGVSPLAFNTFGVAPTGVATLGVSPLTVSTYSVRTRTLRASPVVTGMPLIQGLSFWGGGGMPGGGTPGGGLNVNTIQEKLQELDGRMKVVEADIREIRKGLQAPPPPVKTTPFPPPRLSPEELKRSAEASQRHLADVKTAFEEYQQAVEAFTKAPTADSKARMEAARKKLAALGK